MINNYQRDITQPPVLYCSIKKWMHCKQRNVKQATLMLSVGDSASANMQPISKPHTMRQHSVACKHFDETNKLETYSSGPQKDRLKWWWSSHPQFATSCSVVAKKWVKIMQETITNTITYFSALVRMFFTVSLVSKGWKSKFLSWPTNPTRPKMLPSPFEARWMESGLQLVLTTFVKFVGGPMPNMDNTVPDTVTLFNHVDQLCRINL